MKTLFAIAFVFIGMTVLTTIGLPWWLAFIVLLCI